MMSRRLKTLTALSAGCAALAITAGPASAAPATVSTDAGTVCTLNADATVGGGLLTKPVNFTGTISCSLADPAKPVIVNAGLILRNAGLPLGLGDKSGVPNSPDSVAIPVEEGFIYRCELTPTADCGFTGSQPLGLGGQTYTAIFGAGLTAPAGESWVGVPAGCTPSGPEIACASQDAVALS